MSYLELLTFYGPAVNAVIMGMLLVLTAVAFVNLRHCRRLRRRLQGLLGGEVTGAVDEVLSAHATRLDGLEDIAASLLGRLDNTDLRALNHLQNVALVRFNAFADTGSDLSFALALLDGEGNGVVITSLFGRDESRIYAKPVEKSGSSYPLGAEEKLAISRAMMAGQSRDTSRRAKAESGI
ncbi:MAG: DUF4446 family protein [Bacillota bacterium]